LEDDDLVGVKLAAAITCFAAALLLRCMIRTLYA
jgi:hypothetical protein